MQIAVLGAGGQLGQACLSIPGAVGFTRSQFNLLDLVWPDLGSFDFIVNCAAYTNVDRAETESLEAYFINSHAVYHLAKLYRERFIHIGSDYVFNGQKGKPYLVTDTIDPLQTYGRTKGLGEVSTLYLGGTVLRVSWLWSSTRGFPAWLIEQASRGQEVKVPVDQIGSPTNVQTVVRAIESVIAGKTTGLYHVTDSQPISKYAWAQKILIEADLDPFLTLLPSRLADYKVPRPAYSALEPNINV